MVCLYHLISIYQTLMLVMGLFILHVRDLENSEKGGWMGVYILYQMNASFPKSFFKRIWSGLVILTVNCDEFLQHTHLVISTVDCSDFHQALISEKICPDGELR